MAKEHERRASCSCNVRVYVMRLLGDMSVYMYNACGQQLLVCACATPQSAISATNFPIPIRAIAHRYPISRSHYRCILNVVLSTSVDSINSTMFYLFNRNMTMFDIELDEGNPSVRTFKLPYNKTGNSIAMESIEILYMHVYLCISLLSLYIAAEEFLTANKSTSLVPG